MDVVSIVVLGSIAVFTAVTAPLLLTYMTSRIRAEERRLDYERQDKIAERVAEVARVTAESADHVTEKLNKISNQAAQIHTLVNSDMTAARQAELDATRVVLRVLKRVVRTSLDKGVRPDQPDLDAIDDATARISELEQILADRMLQFRKAEDEIADREEEGQ